MSGDRLALGLLGLASLDRDDVVLGRDRDLLGREAGDRERDLVAIIAEPFNVVRG